MLASVNSTQQNDLLRSLTQPHIGYWIGLNDLVMADNFVWADGTSPTYENWEPYQETFWDANDWEDQHCVFLDEEGLWEDMTCWTGLYFFCQRLKPSKKYMQISKIRPIFNILLIF